MLVEFAEVLLRVHEGLEHEINGLGHAVALLHEGGLGHECDETALEDLWH